MTKFLEGLVADALAINLDKLVQKDFQEVGKDEVVLCTLNDELKRWSGLLMSIKDECARLVKHIESGEVVDVMDLMATAKRLTSKADVVSEIFWESVSDFLEKQPGIIYTRGDNLGIRKDWQVVKITSKCDSCPMSLMCPVREVGKMCSGIGIIEIRRG